MVLGRSTTLRRDPSIKVQPGSPSSRLLRSFSTNIKANGRTKSGSCQAIQRATKDSGRMVLKAHLRFYGKYLIPEIAVTVLMFACFSAMAALIPRLLCNADAKDSMSMIVGFKSCVLKGWNTGNVVTSRGAAIFWLIFYAVQYSWLTVFPTIIGKVLCPKGFQRKHLIACSVCAAACAIVVLVAVPLTHWSFSNLWLTFLSNETGVPSWTSCTAVFVIAQVVQLHTGSKIMGYRWIALMFFCAGVTTVYLQIMPSLITARSSTALNGMGLTIVRLFIHPVIWSAVMMLFRQFMLHSGSVPDLMQVCFVLYPALYSSIFGRFLLLQLDSVGSVFLINLMQCSLQLAARLSDRGADDLWMSTLYGARGAEAINARYLVEEMRFVELFTTSLAENGGILAASALMSFGRVGLTPGQPPNHSAIWINAGGQLITGFVFDFIGLCVEAKYHCFEWERAYPKSIKRVMKYVAVIIIIGSTRLAVELMLLFCPHYDEATGVTLHSCDRPSLFQAINVAFAVRNRNTALGSYLDLNSTSTL
ncbi:hypothetical protein ACKKBF_B32050 [Auxenochlorella protothecoides x Auxenochlorella symbiontica]